MIDGKQQTIQSIYNLWFMNFQNSCLGQYVNLFALTNTILNYFNKDGKYDAEISEVMKIFVDPVTYYKEKFPTILSRKKIQRFRVSQLDWLYYRDTKFQSKLGKVYFIDSRRSRDKKEIWLNEVIDIVAFVKIDLSRIIYKVMMENNVTLDIPFIPTGTELKQLGAKGDV